MTRWFDLTASVQRAICDGGPAANWFIERIARDNQITWEYTTHDYRANVQKRHVWIPPPDSPRELAVCLHEEGHVINGRCPRTGNHDRYPGQGCLACERDAWQTALRLVPFVDRAMHKRLASALMTYRRGLRAPQAVVRDADRLIGSLSWAEHRQRVHGMQSRLERQRLVMADVERHRDETGVTNKVEGSMVEDNGAQESSRESVVH